MKGIIFDLDGVIVFTDNYHYLAWKKIAEELNIYFDESINNRLRGISRMDSLNIILENYSVKKLSDKDKELIATKKNDLYREYLKTMKPQDVSDEIRKALKELRRRGYKLAIGSSSKNAKYILKQVDLLDSFDVISDGTNITKSKPDPEVFLCAAKMLDLDPSECAVVEDGYAGIEAAKKGGFMAIGIYEAANYSLSDYKIEKFSDLLKLFDKSEPHTHLFKL